MANKFKSDIDTTKFKTTDISDFRINSYYVNAYLTTVLSTGYVVGIRVEAFLPWNKEIKEVEVFNIQDIVNAIAYTTKLNRELVTKAQELTIFNEVNLARLKENVKPE
jgi:hypothetical protein